MLSLIRNSFKVHDKGEYFPLFIKIALVLNLFNSLYFFRSPFDFYYGYLAYLVLFPKFILKYGIPKHFGIISSILLAVGILNIYSGNNTISSFFKVFIGLFSAYLFFYYVVFKSGVKPILLFKFYLAGSLFCASWGIFQWSSFILGLSAGNNFPWLFGFLNPYLSSEGLRISTFFGEPTYYAMFLSGAVFVAIHDLIFRKKSFFFNPLSALTLLFGVYLSLSGTIVATIAVTLILLAINYGFFKYAILFFPLGLIFINQISESSNEINSRIKGVSEIFTEAPETEFDVFDYHGSAVILYNHFHVALENFKRNPLFGTGIGSHPIAFEKYSLTKNIKVFGFGLNTKDANSMFNRLMSETGLFGLGLFAILLLFGFQRRNPSNNSNLWIISSACLVVILINMGRQGHYFLAGFPFYVWMYYACWKESKTEINPSLPNKLQSSQMELTSDT